MVRDRLRQKEHPEQHRVGFSIDAGNARDQRRHSVVERLIVEARNRIKAGHGIQVVII